eukprot:jgi/Mesen1/5575/ME000281S04641
MMLEDISGLTDVGAMTRLLHEIIARERDIDLELERFLSQRGDLEKKLGNLYKAAEVLELVRSDSDQIFNSVKGTCALAEHVSGKVRELDLAQSRVQDTISRIDAIVDRSQCIDGAKTALENEDYEAAAKSVETFLQLDKQYSLQVAGEGHAETALEQKRQLLESKARLEEVIRRRFAAAAESRDQASVERFAKLFAPLGLQEEGLRSYVSYLRRVVAIRAREEFDGLSEMLEEAGGAGAAGPGAGAGLGFVDTLVSLFRDIALAVEHNEETLRGIYGEDGIVWAIQELQEECDSRGSIVVKRYIEHRRLTKLSRDVASAKGAGSGRAAAAAGIVAGMQGGSSADNPNPRDVEGILEEIQTLSKVAEEYARFMAARMRDAEASGAQVSPRAAGRLRAGGLSRAVQELASHFVQLEEYVVGEDVRKAIKIDEAPPDALTSSMVDDVFYILQSCARRAVDTCRVQAVLASLHCANNALNNEFREALQRRLREPNLAQKLFSAAGGGAGVGKLKTCLNDLSETSTALKQLAAAGLEQLSDSINPRLRVVLDTVAGVSYDLTEAQYAENEVNDPWVQALLHAVEASVEWLQPLLTGGNYDALVHLVIDFVTRRLEALILQKRFNQLGGLQLDRDARALVGHFSAMTPRTVRDKFARLTQMATILNLEKVSEILDYWGENSGPMTWRLTPAEVRRVLGLRVDFRTEAINALKL